MVIERRAATRPETYHGSRSPRDSLVLVRLTRLGAGDLTGLLTEDGIQIGSEDVRRAFLDGVAMLA